MDFNIKSVDLTEYVKQIRDEHNHQLMQWLTQVFLSDEQHLSDFEIRLNGNRYLTHRFILSLFIPYLLAMCPENNSGIQIEGIENYVLEIILNYCYTGKLEPNENNFFSVLETATHLYMNAFVIIWCETYEQQIEDPVIKLMHKRRIAAMFGWIDKIEEINQSLDRIAREESKRTSVKELHKTNEDFVEPKFENYSKIDDKREIAEEISEQKTIEKPIPEPKQTDKEMPEHKSAEISNISSGESVPTLVDEQIQVNFDSFSIDQNKVSIELPKEETKISTALAKEITINSKTHFVEYEDDDEEYGKALESFRKSYEDYNEDYESDNNERQDMNEKDDDSNEEEIDEEKEVKKGRVETTTEQIVDKFSVSESKLWTLYLFTEVFVDGPDEGQYIFERDFMSYIYKSENGDEWQLYRKFVNHFRTSYTCFVNYKSDILLIGALSKIPKSNEMRTSFIANKYCMKYMGDTRFKTFPNMKYSRARHAVAVVKDVLYAIGGISKLEHKLESAGIKLKINNSVEYYDESTSKWVILDKKLPVRVYSMAALQFNNQLWIIGGMAQNQSQKLMPIEDIYAYDPNKGDMIRIRYKLPKACAFMSAIAVDDKLFVIGGKILANSERDSESLEITNEVWIFDLKEKEWTKGPSLNCPRCKTCVIKRSKIIYAFGGVIDGTNKKCAVVETLDTNNLRNGWTRHEDLPTHISGYKIVFGKSY